MILSRLFPNNARTVLTATTALAAAILGTPHSYAADVTVSTLTHTSQTMVNGETLTVTHTGGITANPALRIPNNVTADKISNAGSIDSGNYGIYAYNGANIAHGIVNTGTLKGNSDAIYVLNGADIAGGIDNAGLISGKSGSSYGIRVYNNANISGGIENRDTGTISGGYYGIVSSHADISGGISNSGLIYGRARYGIDAYNSADIAGTIANTGTIKGGIYGAYIYKAHVTGGIENGATGTFTGNTGGITVYQSADIAGGIKNDGVITGNSYGAYVYRGDISGGIENRAGGLIHGGRYGVYNYVGNISGGITNAANATISGGNYGVYDYYNANIAGGIANAGTIKGGDIGLYVYRGSANISGGVANAAGARLTGGDTGIYVRSGHVSGGIVNSGLIAGGTRGIYAYRSSLTGGITNETGGTISGGGGTAIALTSLTATTPITITGGSIIGHVIDNAPANNRSPVTIGGDFKTQGNFSVSSLTVNSGATLEISSANTFTVNHMNPSAGGICFAVSSHNAGGFGKLVVNGAGKGLALANTSVSVDAAGTPLLNKGDALLIGDGNAAVTGGPGAVPQTVSDNSALWDFQIVNGTYGALHGDSTQLYLLTSFQPAGNGNSGVKSVLNALGNTPDPALSAIISHLNAASTRASYDDILSSTQPNVSGASYQAAQGSVNTSLGLVTKRLSIATQPAGLSAGNTVKMGDMEGWVQGFGGHAVQGAQDGLAGYRSNTGGVMMGIDTAERYASAKAGLAVSYAATSSAARDVNRTQSSVNSYQLTLYGEKDFAHDVYVRAMAAYARNETHTARHDVGGTPGLNAYGEFGANQYALRMAAGRGCVVNKALTVTPSILANLMHYDPNDYTETGAGGANLHVTQKPLNMAELGFGVNATWQFKLPNDMLLSPSLGLSYRHDLIGDRLESTSAFTGGGTAFASIGAAPARDRFSISPQLRLKARNGWETTVGYSAELRRNYVEHSGFLRVTWHF